MMVFLQNQICDEHNFHILFPQNTSSAVSPVSSDNSEFGFDTIKCCFKQPLISMGVQSPV